MQSVARWLCLGFSVFAGLIALAAASGTLWPGIPVIGVVGAALTGMLALHVILVSVAGAMTALLARRFGSGRIAVVLTVVNALAALILIVPLASQVNAARRAGATLSWESHLRAVAPGPRPVPTRTVQYGTADGKQLQLDIYAPTVRASAVASTPVVMIHGGGFVYGNRSDGRDWDRWFAQAGYTVFDVDYRLTPPVTWNLAAADVACAMAWIREHQRELNVVAAHTLIVGQSAGASLALQVAYGIGDNSVTSGCGGIVDTPVAVFALYPVEDFRVAWEENLTLGPANGREINTGYIGGSPEQFPERYRAVSPIDHLRPGLPPTMIAFGTRDHLVPVSSHAVLQSRLQEFGVPNVLVDIPYSDHGYDLVWGSLGAQITRHALANFLSANCPFTPPPAIEEPGP